MAKTKQDNSQPVDSTLVKSREEVRKLITDQISAAEPILQMEVRGQELVDYGPFGGRGAYWSYDERQKEAFYNACKTWDSFNREILTRSFEHPNNTYRSEYENIGKVFFVSGHENFVEDERKTIREKVNFLDGFLTRIELIPCKVEGIKENLINNCIQQDAQIAKTPKIFISHNTKDSNYAKAIIDMLVQLGVKHDEIFCSSIPGYGIPLGGRILNVLHNQFDEFNLFVIFIHSPRYYQSTISLNEMGAAWILRSEHRSFLTSDCTFDMLQGVIDNREIAYRASQKDTEHLLHDFRSDIVHFFHIEPIPDAVWETTKSEFIDKTSNFKYVKGAEKSQADKPYIEKENSSTEREQMVLDFLKRKGHECSVSEISSYLSLSMNTTRILLQQMLMKDIVKTTTSGKYAKYTI